MRPQDTDGPELTRRVEDELGAGRETPAVEQEKTWQEMKARIKALRRELHAMPVSLIGDSCWADRIRELKQCQRILELSCLKEAPWVLIRTGLRSPAWA
jgi:hypothetical protein